MDTSGIDAIKTVLDNLRDSYTDVETAFRVFEEQDLAKENALLRERVEQLSLQLRASNDEIALLQDKHNELAGNFKHELSSKRSSLLNLNKSQHQAYLEAGLEREHKRISELYADLHKTLAFMSTQIHSLDVNEREPLMSEMHSLHARVNEQVRQSHVRKENAWRNVAKYHSNSLDELANPPIEDAALTAVRMFFAWETFLGLKIISAVGALLLLLGVFTFGRYLTTLMGPAFQCVAILALGLILMGAGEVFHIKKWRGGFTVALTASGIGVLFLGAALGYLTLGVLPMWAALAVCAVVSLLSFGAALRYNAQLVAIFALVGGYLPIIALESELVFFAGIYFTILSLLALLVATRKRWQTTRFIGLFAGLISGLVMAVAISRTQHWSIEEMAVGVSIAIGFIAYLIIPVFGAWFTKTSIRKSDIFLLSCNVFFYFLLMLYWINGTPLSVDTRSLALPSAFVALCCIIMALISERQKHSGIPESETGSLRALFFITSVTFVALTILFALDSVWFSSGLLVQATGLILYGLFKNRQRFNIAGATIGAICLYTFLMINIPYHNDPLFVWQYLSIAFATMIISLATLKCTPKSNISRVWLDIFRGIAVFNFWGFIVYALHNPLLPTLTRGFGAQPANNIVVLFCITLGFIFAFLLPRIKHIYNYGFHTSAIILGAVNIIWLLIFNATFTGTPGVFLLNVVVFSLFAIVNVTGIAWINDLLRFSCRIQRLPLTWYPLLLSGFAVLLVTQNLIVQLQLEASSFILTLLFGLTAFAWVLFGFIKRNGIARIAGLSMAFFAVIKLFVLDLHHLGATGRIVSYFVGGLVLLTISFTYQWFSKRLDKNSNSDTTVHNSSE